MGYRSDGVLMMISGLAHPLNPFAYAPLPTLHPITSAVIRMQNSRNSRSFAVQDPTSLMTGLVPCRSGASATL